MSAVQAHTCKRQPDGMAVGYAGGTVWELTADGRVVTEVNYCPFCGLKFGPPAERRVVHLFVNGGAAYYCGGRVGKWSGAGSHDASDANCKKCIQLLERHRVLSLQRRDIMPVTEEAQPEGSPCA